MVRHGDEIPVKGLKLGETGTHIGVPTVTLEGSEIDERTISYLCRPCRIKLDRCDGSPLQEMTVRLVGSQGSGWRLRPEEFIRDRSLGGWTD